MESDSVTRVSVRRAPRARGFVFLGVVIGVVGSLVATSLFPVDPALGFALVAGYLSVWGITLGVTGGLVAWLVADWRSKRRVHEVSVERLGPDEFS
jgi:presenilin-like A22 family membrane protease